MTHVKIFDSEALICTLEISFYKYSLLALNFEYLKAAKPDSYINTCKADLSHLDLMRQKGFMIVARNFTLSAVIGRAILQSPKNI